MESGESAAAGLSLPLVRPVARRRNSINHYRAFPPPPLCALFLRPVKEGVFHSPSLPPAGCVRKLNRAEEGGRRLEAGGGLSRRRANLRKSEIGHRSRSRCKNRAGDNFLTPENSSVMILLHHIIPSRTSDLVFPFGNVVLHQGENLQVK